MTEREFQTIIIDKLDNLERKVSKVDQDNQLLAEKLELYAKVSEAQINSIRAEVEAFQEANQQQIGAFQEANQKQIEAFQEANKQQLNISLGVLVTAVVAILASVVLGMAN